MDKWQHIEFGKFADFKNGLNFLSSDKGYCLKVIGVSDFQQNSSLTTYNTLSEVALSKAPDRSFLLQDDDLLFVRSNGNKALVGRCLHIDKVNEDISFSGFTIRARVNKKIANPKYIAAFFQTQAGKKEILLAGGGTNISNLNQSILSTILIPLPCLDEQDKIVKIITEFGSATQKLESLIETKRDKKRVLMQRLLTGTLRFGEFANQPWYPIKFGDVILQIGDGGTPKRNNDLFFGGDVPWVVIEDIKPEIYSTINTLTQEGLKKSSAKLWPPNTLILSTGASIGFVGIAKVSLATKQGITGIIFNSKKVANAYVYQWLLFSTRLLERYAQGSSFKEIRPEVLKALDLTIPASLDEQHRIATLLSTADREITLLTQKLDAYKQQKKGLMQQLLTGKKRVKLEHKEVA
jgi:type I restriction enzyme S subunit